MKPHLQHIKHTMERKQRANEAGNEQAAYVKYLKLVKYAHMEGFNNQQVIDALNLEKHRIVEDDRWGDSIFQQGLTNAKSACLIALDRILLELRSE